MWEHGAVSDQERIADLVGALVDGWYERVEYKIMVNRQIESRVTSVRQRSLLHQLASEVSGYSPSSVGERYGQPGSRPPGSLDMLDLLTDIDLYLGAVKATGKGREAKLRSLVSISFSGGPEWGSVIVRDLGRFVKTARIMLGYDVPARPLRDTVCGSCGGTLVVAQDADSDVRCVGKPTDDPQVSEPPCGTVYPRWQWVDLLEAT
jgi:hypothetical protein